MLTWLILAGHYVKAEFSGFGKKQLKSKWMPAFAGMTTEAVAGVEELDGYRTTQQASLG
ncbi:MAG: hypothetical protein LC715_04545 [Gammaproteobacteria bacterium]|nr:hypothetical protein [Gammaproteobacteria bacterium]